MSNPDSQSRLLDPEIFQTLKAKTEEEQQVRDQLTQVVLKLERAVSYSLGLFSRIHSTPRSRYGSDPFLSQAWDSLSALPVIVGELSELASKHPYYKYNFKWNRAMQSVVFTVLLAAWLQGTGDGKPGPLLSLEEVGEKLSVPVNLKDRDAFHVTIEEYLLALTDLCGELSRLATNAVTLGDLGMAVGISAFVKDIFAGFQLLNLKNDILRKRVDGVKYDVKKVEDVVYDLTLRNLIQRPEPARSS